MKPHAFIAVGT